MEIDPSIIKRRNFALNIGLILLLGLVMVTFTAFYLSRERFFYFYDGAGYYQVTADLAAYFRQAPIKALAEIKNSIQLEYNQFFTLPIIPLMLLFSDSRLVYLLGVAVFYQLPYFLLLGALSARLLPSHKRLAFLLGVLVALFNPTVWGPMLRGLPDVGAACLIALAAWVALYDLRLERWWQVVGIGSSLALAIVFRRHFAYAVLAFYMVFFIQVWLSYIRMRPGDWKNARKILAGGLIRWVAMGIITLLVLALIATPMLTRMFSINYRALYASYALPLWELIKFFGEQFGFIGMCLALAGFIWGFLSRSLTFDRTVFLLMFTGISFTSWVILAGQRGTQYTLHFNYLVILGITVLLVTAWQAIRSRWRGWILSIVAIYLLINGVFGLIVEIPYPAWKYFSFPYRPQVRSDYAEVERLVSFLHATVPEGASIFVVDSSYKMNADLLDKAEKTLFGRENAHLSFLETPTVDSRDQYPLAALVQAQYVIVSDVLQVHLRPEEQDVVRVAFEAFNQGWEFAQDFFPLPEVFNLAGNTRLHIFQRLKPTTLETALRTFNRMKVQVVERPGSQADWILISPKPAALSQDKSGRARFELSTTGSDGYAQVAFILVELPPSQGKLSGWLKFSPPNCGELRMTLNTTDEQGKPLSEDELRVTEKETTFELVYHSNQASNLVFRALIDQVQSRKKACSVDLHWKLITP